VLSEGLGYKCLPDPRLCPVSANAVSEVAFLRGFDSTYTGRVEQRETRRFKFARALRIICFEYVGFHFVLPNLRLVGEYDKR
jgi:hypothetical protein